MNDIIQLKITLQGTQPPIWRQVLVEKTTTFLSLHYIIQAVMGWDNSHLFEFKVDKRRIGEPSDNDWGEGEKELIDASEVTLESKIKKVNQIFGYLYDFGDSWRHEILVEKFLPFDKELKYPKCIDGKLKCPPEDCGGVGGYYRLLEIIKMKKHPEKGEMLEWLGEKFDPEYFDIKIINKKLSYEHTNEEE